MGDKKQKTGVKPLLSVGAAWIYAFGIFGIQSAVGFVNSYQSEFYSARYGTLLGGASSLMVIATIILCAKIVSSLADFFIGSLIDKSHFKSGKMRPWILISLIPFVAVTMIMFVYIPFTSSVGAYIYIAFITLLWNSLMSLSDIPSQGMLARLSPVASERSVAAGLSNMMKAVGLALPGVFATLVCFMTGSGTMTQKEYYITAGIMCALALGFGILMVIKNKEKYENKSDEKVSFKELKKELKENKMIIIVFISYILGFARNISMGIAVQAHTVLMRDGINLAFLGMGTVYGSSVSWLFGTTSAVPAMVLLVLIPQITKKLGEKKTFFIFGLYGFIVSTIAFLLYAFGGAAFRTVGAILIYMFFIGFMYASHSYIPLVMTTDIVEYREWQTGKRKEGTQFSILSLSTKLSNALSVAIGIFLCGALGYNSEAYTAAINNGQNMAEVIPDKTQTAVFAVFVLLPGISSLLAFLPMLWYKIDEKTKVQMREELQKRREQEALVSEIE